MLAVLTDSNVQIISSSEESNQMNDVMSL